MRHRLFMHVVWTTRNRQALVDLQAAEFLVEYLPVIARQERARLIEVGVVSTHLHLLLRVHPSTELPRLLQRMKGGSAMALNRLRGSSNAAVRWAKGYNIESVSVRALGDVVCYIRDQHHHHPGDAIAGWPRNPSL
jgi:putative transposase